MGHQAFQAGVMRVAECGQDFRRAGARAQAAHAGIDLQVVADGLAGGGGETVHVADLRQGVDGRREIEFHDGIALRRARKPPMTRMRASWMPPLRS